MAGFIHATTHHASGTPARRHSWAARADGRSSPAVAAGRDGQAWIPDTTVFAPLDRRSGMTKVGVSPTKRAKAGRR
jgi:hypothetical protein